MVAARVQRSHQCAGDHHLYPCHDHCWLLVAAARGPLGLADGGRFPSAAALRGQLFAGEISLAFGAVLLMIPGLISDVIALYVFLRAALRALLGGAASGGRRDNPMTEERDIPPRSSAERDDRGPVTLEGDFSRVDDD